MMHVYCRERGIKRDVDERFFRVMGIEGLMDRRTGMHIRRITHVTYSDLSREED